MDYQELVKSLRRCANGEGCARCNQQPKFPAICIDMLLYQAADAIEELSSDKRRWIPVTERLPEEKRAVLVWQPQYLNSYKVVMLSDGEWYVLGGYGTRIFGVTHWMPLPEPPKEDE